MIVVTGDLVDDHAADVDAYAAALGRLAAPLGTWAVPGNHDVYAGWPAVRERLAALPLGVLVNEWRWVERDGARFVLLGTGDPAGGRGGTATGGPDLERAFAGVPDYAFVVALAHNPALWPALARRGTRLTLSGHTHWGQLAIPAIGWSLASPFNAHAMGGYVDGESVLYVHPGSNFWGIPFRLGTPPEVAVVTLRRTRPPARR
jgi:predicted MPP superfamily phosphohydrolase